MKWNFADEKEDYLYHFTKSDTAIFKILPTEKLRLNEFMKTNDPREYENFGFGGINADFEEENFIEQYIREQEIISTKLKANCKVLCFCEDYHLDGEWWDGFNLLRMWAQYGENHQGVCLVIDRKVFLEENQDALKSSLTFIDRIKYTNKNNYPFIDFKDF